jgi:hypothetical protein
VQGGLQVVLRQIFQTLEKRLPYVCMIKPSFPMGLELLLDRFGKLPKRDALGWIKYLTTAMRSDREYGTSLCKVMGARKTPPGRGSAKSAKLSSGVPPLGDIHFAKSRNDQSKFQQAIEIYSCLRHWPHNSPPKIQALGNFGPLPSRVSCSYRA